MINIQKTSHSSSQVKLPLIKVTISPVLHARMNENKNQ